MVNAQSAGILTVLVFGAGTDYALLLVARYREELRRHDDRHEAMALALHRAGPAIIASAATVAIGMSCLTLAEVNSTSGLGPVAAIGIVVGLLAMITLLPALLVIFGRWLFWPVRPEVRHRRADRDRHLGPARRPDRRAARGSSGSPPRWCSARWRSACSSSTRTACPRPDQFTTKPPSVTGEEALARHFPAGQGQPVVVIGQAGVGRRGPHGLRRHPGHQRGRRARWSRATWCGSRAR